jgi:hypothetical protein
MIFVSIAAYKDADLPNTIASLYENADCPDAIRVVVLAQVDTVDSIQNEQYPNVETFYVDAKKSKGVCWARAILQSMARDEEYYLQIDAHMRFAKGWDTKMIAYLKQCNSKKPVLSFYPPAMIGEDLQQLIQRNVIRGVGTGAISSIGHILNKELTDVVDGKDLPIISHTSAAGFLFAPIEFIHEVPIDPKLYWNYEETDITLRGYTSGWDFFATPEPLIWHKYNTTGKIPHMEGSSNWVALENESNAHAPRKYFDDTYSYPDKYKLGKARTIESYEIIHNISLKDKVMTPKAGKKMLVVVPYRDRAEHIKVYLERVPKYMKDISCDFLICELNSGCEWNAGLTCNSLINFLRKDDYQYIYISHVDVYPYQGWEWPEDGEFISDLGDVGSCLVKTSDFLKVGGYGNNFWGWGGEDDNLYNKLQAIGLKRRQSTVLFDTTFQSHDRPFNGLNYTNNLREIYKPHDFTTIFKSNKMATTYGLTRLGENIYKQHVDCKIQRPKHKKAVIGYIKDVKEFQILAPWVKSSVFYGTDYDVWMVVQDDMHDNQLRAFGINLFKYEPKYSYIFVDRFNAFKEFLEEYHYEEIIHVDVTDSYFQANPFSRVSGGLNIVSEEILIKDCQWNTNMLMANYGYSFPESEVLCGGLIHGERELFMQMCEKIIEEYVKLPNASFSNGSDQAIINKIIYSGELRAFILDSKSPLAAHLHHHFKSGINNASINGTTVVNNNGERFAIVHQYNRNAALYGEVLDYFNKFFANDQLR